MRSARFMKRVVPALALCTGSAVWAEPGNLVDLSKTGTVVSKPMPASQELPTVPTLALPTVAPAPPGAPLEAGPAPKVMPSITIPKDAAPPPMPLPKGATIVEGPSGLFIDGVPLQPGLAYGRAEYLFWYLTGGNLPPLATTGPATDPIGAPGFPGDTILFGGDKPLNDPRSGVRLTLGTWLDVTRTIGVEASGFYLASDNVGFIGGSTDGSNVVASSPFIDANTGLPSAVLISFPGLVAGTTDISYVGRAFWGGEALGRVLLSSGFGWRLDGLVGYRYRSYTETLNINKTIIPISPLFIPGSMIVCNDGFRAENEFNGGVLGIDLQKDFGCWTLNVRPSAAIGRIRNEVTRDGITLISVPGTPDFIAPGGTYNLISNIGTINSQDWTVLPELDVRVSKTVWNCVRLSVGYTAMYFPLLSRAGEQIDPVINPNLIPPVIPVGPSLPQPFVERSSAWLHGFSVGVEVRF